MRAEDQFFPLRLLTPTRMMQSTPNGLLTEPGHSGTFGNVFPFMSHLPFWLSFWSSLVFIAGLVRWRVWQLERRERELISTRAERKA
jgi:hypothetical protein